MDILLPAIVLFAGIAFFGIALSGGDETWDSVGWGL